MTVQLTTTRHASNFIKTIVYSESGIGKTTLCSTAPDPIIISTERKLLSLRDFDIPALEVSSAVDVFEAARYAVSTPHQTICLDSVSDIAEVILSDYIKQTKDPRQAYGKMAQDVLDMIKWFRFNINKHIYVIAQAGKMLDPYSNILKYSAYAPGQVLPLALPYNFDEVFALRIGIDPTTQQSYRYLQTQPDLAYSAKDSSNKLEAVEFPHLGNIFNKILT